MITFLASEDIKAGQECAIDMRTGLIRGYTSDDDAAVKVNEPEHILSKDCWCRPIVNWVSGQEEHISDETLEDERNERSLDWDLAQARNKVYWEELAGLRAELKRLKREKLHGKA